ncbi:MAG: hypothetical protein K2K32_04720 [Muribaculaceae bacterium]|nr:hypothetical protein [Muribaculaceae bacterium]
MKYFLRILIVAVAMVTAIPSFAVSDKEMEQARAIAAKHYLRYANNGSDYLDKINPSSVSELSKSLKAKEQENIKSFNAVAVPKDYASWDKQKLVEYWSSTFFKSPGLKEDGKKCLSILAKNLNKINVSAAAPKEAAQAPQEPAKEVAPATPKPETPAKKDDAQPSAAPASPADAAVSPSDEPSVSEVDEAIIQAEADAGVADEQTPKSSNTGWYIGILIVLIGVVVWLVMYASKSMKETGSAIAGNKDAEKEIRETKKAAKEELNKMREQYANSLTSKNDEIKNLKARCDALESQLETAHRETDNLKRELAAAKQAAMQQQVPVRDARPQDAQVRESRQQMQPSRQQTAQTSPAIEKKTQAAPAKGPGLPPVVFLGNVNQKGLFTKASRSLNMEYSVYRMDIPDGHHGVFKVVNNPDILDRLLEDPQLWLAGGCVIENPEDADIATEIVTLQEGEALFADNSCRVTQKARIKFI